MHLVEVNIFSLNNVKLTPTLQSCTGPEQGFPCEVFLTGKNLFSFQGTPFLISGTLISLQGMGLQCTKIINRADKNWAHF